MGSYSLTHVSHYCDWKALEKSLQTYIYTEIEFLTKQTAEQISQWQEILKCIAS